MLIYIEGIMGLYIKTSMDDGLRRIFDISKPSPYRPKAYCEFCIHTHKILVRSTIGRGVLAGIKWS
jgi:hypothetical protein